MKSGQAHEYNPVVAFRFLAKCVEGSGVLCQLCHQRPATRRLDTLDDKGIVERHVCDVCAAPLDLEPLELPSSSKRESAKRGDLHFRLYLSDGEIAQGAAKEIRLRRKRLCPTCDGAKRGSDREPCRHCNGRGLTEEPCRATVKMPAGLKEGKILRLKGQGDVRLADRARGDVYLEIARQSAPVLG